MKKRTRDKLYNQSISLGIMIDFVIVTQSGSFSFKQFCKATFLLMVTQSYSNMISETIPDNDHTTPFCLQQYPAVYIYTIPEDFALG